MIHYWRQSRYWCHPFRCTWSSTRISIISRTLYRRLFFNI